MEWYNSFFIHTLPETNVITGHYNLSLVLLSYIIASLAAYIAFDMSAHLRKATTRTFRLTWLASGSLVMGAGIWSMHFIGMLSYNMPVPRTFDILWTTLSMFLAVIASLIAFLLFMQQHTKLKHYFLAGTLLGIAVLAMNYLGMAGMNGVTIQYRPLPFFASIAIAVIAASIALRLSRINDHGLSWQKTRLKLDSALIMGMAICGMHYMGVYAAVFTQTGVTAGGLTIDPTLMSIFIAAITMSILLIALILSTYKYYFDTSLKNKSDFLHAVLNKMSGGVILCDSTGALTLYNDAMNNIYGPPLKKVRYISEWAIQHPLYKADDELIKLKEHPLATALKGKAVKHVEIILQDYKGQKHIMEVDGQPLKNPENEDLGAIMILSDISQRKNDEELLLYRATHDMLTGLPNRVLLRDRMELAIAFAAHGHLKLTIIFIDIDNFKYVNDSFGHVIGDQVLQMIANRFKALLLPSETLARFGSDQFVIVVPTLANAKNIRVLLRKIIEIMEEPCEIEGHSINVTCSIGFSVYPENGTDAESLLTNADNAMYQAKEKGKNNFQFFNEEMNLQVKRRFEIEADLREAVVNEEFFLEYQPKLDLKTNKVVGCEALVRWLHPKMGIISPTDFIAIAEDTGLIIPLGEWVLKTACVQGKAWQKSGMPPLLISVNLSAKQCEEKDIFKKIKGILDESGLKPENLELELTETMAMSNPVEFIKLLKQFKEYGIETSIDDFGTGYSSLNYLRQFPVGCLKIDKTFIDEIATDKADMSIVKAIVSLGHSLNMRVIAEGVETKEQLNKLHTNNCDEIQGYYLSRPLSAEAMAIFVKEYHDANKQNKKT